MAPVYIRVYTCMHACMHTAIRMSRLAVVVLQYKLYKLGLEEEQYKRGFRLGVGIVQGLGFRVYSRLGFRF